MYTHPPTGISFSKMNGKKNTPILNVFSNKTGVATFLLEELVRHDDHCVICLNDQPLSLFLQQ